MFLTLEVISPNGEALGANRRRTVGPEGVQIGRSKENDWVIADPYLSRVNARIRCVNGAFYIEGVGRVPLALNDASNVVANNEPMLLRSGDRFFLDQYEIRATIATSAGGAAAPLLDDPFSLAGATSRVVPGEWAEGTDKLDLDIRDSESAGDVNLDPLEALGGSAPKAAAPKQIDLDQGSVLDDHFEAPRPQPARADPVVGPIPDAWDRSRFTAVKAGKPAPRQDARPRPAKGMSPAADIPDAWDRTNKPSGQHPPASSNVAARTVRRAGEGAVGTEVRGSAGPVAPFGSTGSASSTISLEALLQAAGVPATRMSPELAAELGAVFRIVVQGLMEVLQSRAEIKSQLRMSMTRMQSTENNPLKFSPNVEAALHTLLVDRNRGYLPTKRAFEEALLDIRNHQIAVLQGIRVAFDAMLEQFDPARLEAEFGRSSKRGGLLSGGGKSRFHDRYVEQFKKLTSDRDESFRRLFGEHFAQAYEEQMAKLKAAARTSGDSTAQAKNREPER
jgi:type VI secretion system FHA domain protein